MFQALSDAPAATPRQSQPQNQGFGGNTPPPSFAAPPAPAQGGGEFTRMMQTLGQPAATPGIGSPQPFAAQPVSPQPGGSQPAASLPFFAEAPMSGGGGASEFTRVMRGPSFRDSAAPAAPASVAAPVAPGLAIAPAKPEDKAAATKPVLSKTVMIALVAFIVVLLIALIVLVILLMKKH